jgi:hypothetical protein
MGQYGQAALDAIKLVKSRLANTPSSAWNQATRSFPTSSQAKSCPKSAFLGLCSDGYVRGISSGNYTRSRDNKRYAIKAADMLKTNPSLITLGEVDLWRRVMKAVGKPVNKTHNQQMEVVLELFRTNQLI